MQFIVMAIAKHINSPSKYTYMKWNLPIKIKIFTTSYVEDAEQTKLTAIYCNFAKKEFFVI